MLFEIKKGTLSRGGEVILDHFDFEIRGTEKIGLIGPNGCGKTTLLEAIAGERDLDPDEKTPEAGIFRARKFSVGMLTQKAVQDPTLTVEESILQTVRAAGEGEYSGERYDYEQRFDRIFTELGFSTSDKRKKLGSFSGGEQTKIMLIGLLLAEPEVLLLDEPTNYLDLETTEWLEGHLKVWPKAVVMVSHDRFFLDQTADTIWEIAGKKTIRYAGNYTQFRVEKQKRRARQEKEWEAQQAEIRRLDALIEKFKHKPRKAAFARSRKKILDRMERIGRPGADAAVIQTGEILPAAKGSRIVLSAEHLQFGYGAPVGEISVRIRRGQKIGIFGPNGSGKSTFVKTAAGLLPPLSGKLQTGEGVTIGYFDQKAAELASGSNVFSWFHEKFPALTGEEERRILAGFLFREKDLGKKVSDLSGGEKARLTLAGILQERPNFLILDEPTNHMDIAAKETLESVFRAYRGTILFVSHDRYFLSRVADALLCFTKDGGPVLYYPFGYAHYEERRKNRPAGLPPAALTTAENKRLVEELQAVPEAERFRLRELSTTEAYFDWQFGLLRPEKERAEAAFAKASDEYFRVPQSEEDWETADQTKEERLKKLEESRKDYTNACLAWYDIWLDTKKNSAPPEPDAIMGREM